MEHQGVSSHSTCTPLIAPNPPLVGQRKLKLWLENHYGEACLALAHVKAIRAFVESVLRYGLPVNFSAFLLKVPDPCCLLPVGGEESTM
jgi:hypothetical protein